MPEYARVVTFEADDAAIDALVKDVASTDTPPDDLPVTRIVILANREAGQLVVATRFASAEDLERGSAILEGMSPPSDAGNIRRVSVDKFEVLLERHA